MNDDKLNRSADLHYAYQHGQDAAKGDSTAANDFKQKFAGDADAQSEYQRGLAEQHVRQSGISGLAH